MRPEFVEALYYVTAIDNEQRAIAAYFDIGRMAVSRAVRRYKIDGRCSAHVQAISALYASYSGEQRWQDGVPARKKGSNSEYILRVRVSNCSVT